MRVVVGRIGRPHGIRGEVTVEPRTDEPDARFAPGSVLHVDGPVRQLTVGRAHWHSGRLLIAFEGVDDRNAAEALRGARIFVSRTSFPTPAEGEYYWVDLIGLPVVNREGLALGEVRELLSTGPQTVLVVGAQEGDKPVERMIPFVSAFIDAVDLPGRRITVDWQPDY